MIYGFKDSKNHPNRKIIWINNHSGFVKKAGWRELEG
jgi:hypothetical protein